MSNELCDECKAKIEGVSHLFLWEYCESCKPKLIKAWLGDPSENKPEMLFVHKPEYPPLCTEWNKQTAAEIVEGIKSTAGPQLCEHLFGSSLKLCSLHAHMISEHGLTLELDQLEAIAAEAKKG